MSDEHAEVERAVEGIKQHVAIDVSGKLTAVDAALENAEGLGTAWDQPPIGERGDQFGIRLASADERANNAAARAAKDAGETLHLGAKIFAYRPGIRETRLTDDRRHEGIGDEHGLVGPPAIDRGLSHPGVGSDRFNGQFRKTHLFKQFQSTTKDRSTSLFAPGPARRTFLYIVDD